jgi:hypothetical protein
MLGIFEGYKISLLSMIEEQLSDHVRRTKTSVEQLIIKIRGHKYQRRNKFPDKAYFLKDLKTIKIVISGTLRWE